MSPDTKTRVTTQVYEIYIKAEPQAIWDVLRPQAPCDPTQTRAQRGRHRVVRRDVDEPDPMASVGPPYELRRAMPVDDDGSIQRRASTPNHEDMIDGFIVRLIRIHDEQCTI